MDLELEPSRNQPASFTMRIGGGGPVWDSRLWGQSCTCCLRRCRETPEKRRTVEDTRYFEQKGDRSYGAWIPHSQNIAFEEASICTGGSRRSVGQFCRARYEK